ncbi:MAG: hypothetical protein RIQ81_807 [Pseudomonadota bacterium]|jgi:release factor glutamine methyltransferase
MSENKIWTVMETLQWSAGFLKEKGSESPRIDAELLLCAVLDFKRVELYTKFDRPLNESERARYRDHIRRRASGEPVAYILGSKGFAGLEFTVSPAVLIPRPETELLVEKAFFEIERLLVADPARKLRVLDAGTGSGCIPVTIAVWWRERLVAKYPGAGLSVHAWDVSDAALAVARDNARRNSVEDTITFAVCDMRRQDAFSPAAWDIIISNPPYISDAELACLDRSVRDHEPRLALSGNSDGLEFYRALAQLARLGLAPAGKIFLEIGASQGDPVQKLLAAYGWQDVRVESDYAGLARNVIAVNPG